MNITSTLSLYGIVPNRSAAKRISAELYELAVKAKGELVGQGRGC